VKCNQPTTENYVSKGVLTLRWDTPCHNLQQRSSVHLPLLSHCWCIHLSYWLWKDYECFIMNWWDRLRDYFEHVYMNMDSLTTEDS